MADAQERMLKEIFKDFEINSDIINTKIKSINLYKKTNKLEVNILSDKPIKVKDVGAFEKYLIKRFMLKDALIHISYIEGIKNDFLSEWDDILDYLSYKHPLTKALLRNCILDLDGNNLNVRLKLSGSDILYGGNMDKILSDLIFDVFNQKLKIKYIDNDSEEEKVKALEYRQKLQENVIKKVQEKSNILDNMKEDKPEKEKIEPSMQESKTDSNRQVTNNNKQEDKHESKDKKSEEPEEITPLILGRNQNIKDPLVKVIDISIDSGKISLEGEVINTDSRELKTGKFLFMFDLYDGTSTITCKAFIEKDKFKAVSRKNKICQRGKNWRYCTI